MYVTRLTGSPFLVTLGALVFLALGDLVVLGDLVILGELAVVDGSGVGVDAVPEDGPDEGTSLGCLDGSGVGGDAVHVGKNVVVPQPVV